MQTVTMEEAQARLPELISTLAREHEIAITHNGSRVATIHASAPTKPATNRSLLDLPTFPGAVLQPDFNRAEVWDEMTKRDLP